MGELDKIIATYGFTRGDGKTSIVIAGGPKMVGTPSRHHCRAESDGHMSAFVRERELGEELLLLAVEQL